MATTNISDVIRQLYDEDKNDLSRRYARLVIRARRHGIKVSIVAYPKDASSTPIGDFRVVGSESPNLTHELDIVDGYVTGLSWRDVPELK